LGKKNAKKVDFSAKIYGDRDANSLTAKIPNTEPMPNGGAANAR
jgi:hypothetical protein